MNGMTKTLALEASKMGSENRKKEEQRHATTTYGRHKNRIEKRSILGGGVV